MESNQFSNPNPKSSSPNLHPDPILVHINFDFIFVLKNFFLKEKLNLTWRTFLFLIDKQNQEDLKILLFLQIQPYLRDLYVAFGLGLVATGWIKIRIHGDC